VEKRAIERIIKEEADIDILKVAEEKVEYLKRQR